jgi:ankyrin repeat protein
MSLEQFSQWISNNIILGVKPSNMAGALFSQDVTIHNLRANSASHSSSLHTAIITEVSEVDLKQMLLDNANVNTVNKYCETPLHWAAQVGNTAYVEILLAFNANAQAKDNGKYSPYILTFDFQQEINLYHRR